MENTDYLKANFGTFLTYLGFTKMHAESSQALIGTCSDEIHQNEQVWHEAGIPFNHGSLLYLLTYVDPYQEETSSKKLTRSLWVVESYPKYKTAIYALEGLRLAANHHRGFPHSNLAWAEAHNAQLSVRRAFSLLTST